MIRIIDDYLVDSDGMNYTLYREIHGQTKEGEPLVTRKALGYFTSLESAIKYCRQDYIRREHQKADMTLSDALDVIAEANQRFEQILKERVGG